MAKRLRKVRMLTAQQRIVRSELLRTGLTMAAIAKRMRVSRAAVARVVSGDSRSRRIENRICQYVGLPWAALFLPTKRPSFRLQRNSKRGRSVYLIVE